MKRILSLILAALCLLSLFSCQNKDEDDDGHVMKTDSANKIVFGEKYISEDSVSMPKDKQSYYIFEDDLLIYHRYYADSFSSTVYHYTTTYKYEVMDEGTLAYFFHSHIIHEDDSQYGKTVTKDDKNGILLFSENVLSTADGVLYIRESYLKKELPNFGQKTTQNEES